jgi:hypothetical protein
VGVPPGMVPPHARSMLQSGDEFRMNLELREVGRVVAASLNEEVAFSPASSGPL